MIIVGGYTKKVITSHEITSNHSFNGHCDTIILKFWHKLELKSMVANVFYISLIPKNEFKTKPKNSIF
ncbi:hypothetical protein BGL57_02370 [Helicobacter pylori]|nr:hypothetical protein [Helicobacter pylori]OPG23359.1 hypothetical protein BGL57_02370 [Helicobacter pylori]QEF26880.1 hypothetical protein D2C83_04195 [Helicobacter pylori]